MVKCPACGHTWGQSKASRIAAIEMRAAEIAAAVLSGAEPHDVMSLGERRGWRKAPFEWIQPLTTLAQEAGHLAYEMCGEAVEQRECEHTAFLLEQQRKAIWAEYGVQP